MKLLLSLCLLLFVSYSLGCNQPTTTATQASTEALQSSSSQSPEFPAEESKAKLPSEVSKDVAGDTTQLATNESVVVDRLARQVRFQTIPRRIISLTPATTELMYAIGAGQQLVGATKNCNYPSEAERLTKVGGGTLQSLSRETIISLQPDLVLCKWDNHQPLMGTLQQFNIPALAIGPENLDELFKEAAMLGQVTGHVKEADELIARMKKRLENLTSRVKLIPEAQQRKVFYEVWDEPLMTAGPGSFIGEILQLAGLQNIFFDATTNYPKVSDELVVARNPDLILAPSTHASLVSVEKMLQRQGWGEVKAIRGKQIGIINGDHISRCGPRILDALEEIIRFAYPDQVESLSTTKESTP